MQTRKLGYTDLAPTTVGLGTWAIGGSWQWGWGPQDDDEAVAGILAGLEAGINWIDTAPVYGVGHSEELVGQALRQTKHKPFLATKCGRLWNEKKELIPYLKRDSIRWECEASLRRLGVERIDLYQMHWPDPLQDIEEAWEEMALLAAEGKVRYLGVCNYNVEQLERVRKIYPVTSLQPPYSLLRRDVEKELLPYCAANGIGVIVYSPMQMGLLTGAFSRERVTALPPDDLRRRNPFFAEPQLSRNLELVEKLKPIAARAGRSLAELAIAWVLRRPEVTAAIVGGRRPAQVEEPARAADWDLGPAEVLEIDRLLPSV